MKKIEFLLILAPLIIGLGCSTRGKDPLKSLLNINGGLGKPTNDFGSMQVTETDLDVGHTFSAFLWPNKPIMPFENLVRDVSLFSRNIDQMTKDYRERNVRMIREKNLWTIWRCNKDTDLPKPQTEPQDCEKIILDPQQGSQSACSCLASNDPILKKLNLDNLSNRMDLGKRIVTMVGTENWLLGGGDDLATRTGSVLKIRPGKQGKGIEVYLRLKHFQKEGMIYKTGSNGESENEGQIVNAKYDPEKKILSFVLIEKLDSKITGNIFAFEMEKGIGPEGSPDLVRFKGDLAKIDAKGNFLAVGGAKFDAEWSPDYN